MFPKKLSNPDLEGGMSRRAIGRRLCHCHPERSEAESKDPVAKLLAKATGSLDFARDDRWGSAPMLGLIIVDHQAGVNDAGDPAEQSQQEAQEKAKYPAGHENGYGWKDDAEEIAERFHIGSIRSMITSTSRRILSFPSCTYSRSQVALGNGVCLEALLPLAPPPPIAIASRTGETDAFPSATWERGRLGNEE
jgi:hypothetical protein